MVVLEAPDDQVDVVSPGILQLVLSIVRGRPVHLAWVVGLDFDAIFVSRGLLVDPDREEKLGGVDRLLEGLDVLGVVGANFVSCSI